MSAIGVSEHHPPTVRAHRAALTWSLVAAGLFLGSAALQLEASLQRWVVFRAGRPPEEFAGEDHRYDYDFPTPEWENIGTAAQVFGIGVLLLAVGVLAMGCSVWALPSAAGPRTAARTTRRAVEVAVVVLVSTSFGLHGAHALVSGLNGTPSPLAQWGVLLLVSAAGLIALCVLWRNSGGPVVLACLALLGSTPLGLMGATFLIAPLVAGYVSHDTTPWTETVVAASAAAAGIAMLCGARTAAVRSAAQRR